MGALSVPMFLGISHLAHETGVVASEGMERTVVAQIALAVFGDGPLFLLVQIVTVAILVLAANTAFADFPRLASVLAKDRFLPHQFVSRGKSAKAVFAARTKIATVTICTRRKSGPSPNTARAICATTVRSMPSEATTPVSCARWLMPRNIGTDNAPMTASVAAALRDCG